MKQFKEKNMELEKRAGELKRYKPKWNFRVQRLKEEKDENTRQMLTDIIGNIMAHWRERMDLILDSVHCLGPKNTNRPQQIIMQFTGKLFSEEL